MKPARIIGLDRPGQFIAMQLRVLAAELAGPERLRRGREYARSGAVDGIEIEDGRVSAIVVGSRAAPYVVELLATPGDGPPGRMEVGPECSCPDGQEAGIGWCKHEIATLLVLADQIAVNPGLLTTWRSERRDDPDVEPNPEEIYFDNCADRVPVPCGPQCESLHAALDGGAVQAEAAADPMALALSVPAGEVMPEIPELGTAAPEPPDDDQLAALLDEAYDVIAGGARPPAGTGQGRAASDVPT